MNWVLIESECMYVLLYAGVQYLRRKIGIVDVYVERLKSNTEIKPECPEKQQTYEFNLKAHLPLLAHLAQ